MNPSCFELNAYFDSTHLVFGLVAAIHGEDHRSSEEGPRSGLHFSAISAETYEK